MLYIKDLKGNEEPLLVKDVHITKQLNGIEQIEFTSVDTKQNHAGYLMIQPRSIITEPTTNQIYRISQNDGTDLGMSFERDVTALQIVEDLDDTVIQTQLTGVQTLDNAMKFALKGTPFTYTIHDSFNSFDFGTDGVGKDHILNLITSTFQQNYGFEFSCSGYHIDIYKSIGQKNAFVFMNNDDIYKLAETADYTQIRTRIFGTGKTTETTSTTGTDKDGNENTSTSSSTITASYTSPNAKIYGVIDDDNYSNDNATTQEQLISEMKAKLKDYPLIQYTASVNKFKSNKVDIGDNKIDIGNYGFIRTRQGLDITSRIIQLDLYPQDNSVEDTLTFGNFVLDPNKMIATLNQSTKADSNAIKELQSNTGGNSTSNDQFKLIEAGEVND